MSATDTKETPSYEDACAECGLLWKDLNEIGLCNDCENSRIAAQNSESLQKIAVAAEIELATSPEIARIVVQKLKDLTAVTAQRDRALGLLEQAIQWVEDGSYAYGEEDSDQRCISCGAVAAHRKDCAIDKLLTEYTADYEALRKGER